MTLTARLRQRIGQVDIHVEKLTSGERVTFPDGFVLSKNIWGNGPLLDGVAQAIVARGMHAHGATEASVIGVKGKTGALYVGGVGQPNSTGVAYWPNFKPITADIVAENATASIGGVSIGGGLGGIEQLRIWGVTILAPNNSASAVTAYMGTDTGRLCLWSCKIAGENRAAWNGHGTKWAVRCHGHLNGRDGPVEAWTRYTGNRTKHVGNALGGGLEMIDCEIQPGQEHAFIYWDNIGPNSKITDIRVPSWYDRNLWCERTLVKGTNRSNVTGQGGMTAGGPSGYGPLEIARIESVRCGGDPQYAPNGDGSAIDLSGHLGPVWIHDLTLRDYHGGAIVVWTDSDQGKGYWEFADGKTTGMVTIEDVDCRSTINTNPAIALGGAFGARIGAFHLEGNHAAIDIDNGYGGPVKTGPVKFDIGERVSTYAGWRSASKMRRNKAVLTAAQLDALVVAP